MKKKVLTLVLAVFLLVAAFPIMSFAGSGENIALAKISGISLKGWWPFAAGFEAKNGEHYTIDSSPYGSDGWYVDSKTDPGDKNNFKIKPMAGYQISTTNGGPWGETALEYHDSGANKVATFYIKEISSGDISKAANESYKMDNEFPTGEIIVNSTKFNSRVADPEFKYFYKDQAEVTFTGKDTVSGVYRIEYQVVESKDEFRPDSNWILYKDCLLFTKLSLTSLFMLKSLTKWAIPPSLTVKV